MAVKISLWFDQRKKSKFNGRQWCSFNVIYICCLSLRSFAHCSKYFNFQDNEPSFFPNDFHSFVSVCVWNCHDPHPFLDFQNYFKSKKLWCKCMQRVLSYHRIFTYQHIRNKSSTDGFECSVNMHINVLNGIHAQYDECMHKFQK